MAVMFGRKCDGCGERGCAGHSDIGSRPYDGNGRYPQTGAYDPPSAAMGGTRAFERNWDVNVWDGSAVHTEPRGNWDKGVILRAETPVLSIQQIGPMYDPTDVYTWR